MARRFLTTTSTRFTPATRPAITQAPRPGGAQVSSRPEGPAPTSRGGVAQRRALYGAEHRPTLTRGSAAEPQQALRRHGRSIVSWNALPMRINTRAADQTRACDRAFTDDDTGV
ncbi:MAG: hypothetical protein ABMA00_21700, partial [Gemmatimonas sp.]